MLAVRGAPALGGAGALGVALAMLQGDRDGWDETRLAAEIDRIRSARPTAVNLAWGVDRVGPLVAGGVDRVLEAALAVLEQDEAANRQLSRLGADWLGAGHRPEPAADRHALQHGRAGHHRPGARRTASSTSCTTAARSSSSTRTRRVRCCRAPGSSSWELTQDGIPHVVQADGAASSTILRGLVDAAIIGADRITAERGHRQQGRFRGARPGLSAGGYSVRRRGALVDGRPRHGLRRRHRDRGARRARRCWSTPGCARRLPLRGGSTLRSTSPRTI